MNDPTPVHVLLVEDNEADAYLVRAMLAEATTVRFAITHVTRLGAAVDILAGQPGRPIDIILLDLSLPDGHGIETVTRAHAVAPHVPIVVMSGNDDDGLAIQGVRDGAQDYLVKGQVKSDLLVRALRYAIERKRVEDRLSAKTREQEAFIYTVSHDLKAPLVAMQGMAGILAEDYAAALGTEGRRYLDRIVANADKMQALLADLLDLARIGRVDADYSVVDLGSVVGDVLESLHHTFSARGARVEIDTPLPVVYASPPRVAQVFTNLLDNAVTYTPPERAPRVAIGAVDGGDRWEIVVRDNGVGIPPAFQSRVLGIFQRLPAGKALNPKGTGVGLSIVARIVEAHGGRLWIESEEGRGTAFHFTLPKQRAEPAAALTRLVPKFSPN